MTNSSPAAIGVVILGAGRSARMGRPKLLLPWGQTTVVGHLLAQWRELGAAQLAVVHAADDPALPAELKRLGSAAGLIPNPAPERGMFSSLQCAAAWPGWRPGLTHWVIALGDQPHLRLDTLRALLALCAAQPDRVCQPACQGHPAHPVALPAEIFRALARSTAHTFKDFLAGWPAPALCDADDPGLALDLDRPEDYERARRLAPPPAATAGSDVNKAV